MSLTTKSRYSLAENSLKICEDLVSELMRQDDAWPFLKPVTKKEVLQFNSLSLSLSLMRYVTFMSSLCVCSEFVVLNILFHLQFCRLQDSVESADT